jgi:Putative mono-oxygenase ydhR
MHTVMWTFKVPEGTSKAQLLDTIKATARTYEGIPGLIRKYYGISPDANSIVGIYLWENQAAANAFYTTDWVSMVTKRWAAPPQRQDWETPVVVESAERRLVAAE